jgi:BirA family biotin operon repressor/biotin-[acetyl-CoA-carboxylase] ligase
LKRIHYESIDLSSHDDFSTPVMSIFQEPGGEGSGLLWKVIRYGQVPSTQDVAREATLKSRALGTVIVAESQTSGRGRRGRSWSSPTGGLYLTAVLRPSRHPGLVPLVAGIAVAEAIRRLTGLSTELKWPNDVLIGGRKVAGVIAETVWRGDEAVHTLLGIGVNVNNALPGDLPRATTLLEELGSGVDAEHVLRELLGEIEVWSERLDEGPDVILEAWRALSGILGGEVDIIDPTGGRIRGVAVDVDQDGALLVDDGGEIRRVHSGALVDATVKC